MMIGTIIRKVTISMTKISSSSCYFCKTPLWARAFCKNAGIHMDLQIYMYACRDVNM